VKFCKECGGGNEANVMMSLVSSVFLAFLQTSLLFWDGGHQQSSIGDGA
jgi:hypothetical protein